VSESVVELAHVAPGHARAVPVVLRPAHHGPRSPQRLHADALAMPETGPLVDTFGRVHTDLRISVTDRCNFRCTYCMPDEGIEFAPSEELLTLREISRVVAVAKRVGIRSVRLTGGEPLVRKGIVDVVAAVAEQGFDDVAMTTNGTSLARLAPNLAAAGLRRVNVSCDSLRPDRFAAIRRRGQLSTTLAAMDAAEAAGLLPLKINVVLLIGENDDEVYDLVEFGREKNRPIRFIEFMPLDANGHWQRDRVIAGADVLATLEERYDLVALDGGGGDHTPATRFAFADGLGEVGFINSVSEPFCGTCDRLRLMADGSIRNCLFSDDEISLRDVMRSQGSDDQIELLLRTSVWGKLPGHAINDPSFLQPRRTMSRIGG
jgi:cyclic pyranopterin phosphate synthase